MLRTAGQPIAQPSPYPDMCKVRPKHSSPVFYQLTQLGDGATATAIAAAAGVATTIDTSTSTAPATRLAVTRTEVIITSGGTEN